MLSIWTSKNLWFGKLKRVKMAQIILLIFDRLKTIVGKEGNAFCQHFLLFPLCFQKHSFSEFSPFPTMFSTVFLFRVFKSHDCVVESQPQTTKFRLLQTESSQTTILNLMKMMKSYPNRF